MPRTLAEAQHMQLLTDDTDDTDFTERNKY
jgi:hypothetical protein